MVKGILKGLDKIDNWLSVFEKGLICISLSVMLILAILQVILRNIFDSGIEWGDVFIRHMVLFLLFFGASLSTRNKSHIQMDVSSKITPKRFKPVVSFLINSFCILITLYLLKASWIFVVDEKASGSILFGPIPTWFFIAIMPIGFAIISFRFLLNWADNIFVILGHKRAPTDDHPVIIGA